MVTHAAPTDWKFAGEAPFTFVTDGVLFLVSALLSFLVPSGPVPAPGPGDEAATEESPYA